MIKPIISKPITGAVFTCMVLWTGISAPAGQEGKDGAAAGAASGQDDGGHQPGSAPERLARLMADAQAAMKGAREKEAYANRSALEAEWAGKIEAFLDGNPWAEGSPRAYILLAELYGGLPDGGAKIQALYDRIKAEGSGRPWLAEFLRCVFYQLHHADRDLLLHILTDGEGAAGTPEAKAAAVFYRGETLLEKGDLAGAKALFERVAAEFPETPFKAKAEANLHEITVLQPGMAAPDFKIPRLDQGEIQLSGLKGKVVLLTFWTHWAPLMAERVAQWVKIQNQHEADPFVMVGVSLDEPHDKETVKKAVADQGMAWVQGFDGKGWNSPLVRLYNLKTIPRAFLVDSKGKIVSNDIIYRPDFEQQVTHHVTLRKAEIQKAKAEADKKKAEEEAKKKAAEEAAAKKAQEQTPPPAPNK